MTFFEQLVEAKDACEERSRSGTTGSRRLYAAVWDWWNRTPAGPLADDNIVEYIATIQDQIIWWCTSCSCQRYIWRGRTASGEILTACCNCQRVLERKKA